MSCMWKHCCFCHHARWSWHCTMKNPSLRSPRWLDVNFQRCCMTSDVCCIPDFILWRRMVFHLFLSLWFPVSQKSIKNMNGNPISQSAQRGGCLEWKHGRSNDHESIGHHSMTLQRRSVIVFCCRCCLDSLLIPFVGKFSAFDPSPTKTLPSIKEPWAATEQHPGSRSAAV